MSERQTTEIPLIGDDGRIARVLVATHPVGVTFQNGYEHVDPWGIAQISLTVSTGKPGDKITFTDPSEPWVALTMISIADPHTDTPPPPTPDHPPSS